MKKYVIIFCIILLFSIIVCGQFLQMHYASDTYNIIYHGYLEYPNLYFLKDARIFSTLALYIANFFDLSINTFIIGMDFIAIIFQCISVLVVYSIIKKIIKIEENTIKDIMIIICSYLIIFNPMAIEYLLFAESAVMCLSVLLTVLATRFFIVKHAYIKALILLILAALCYQRNNRIVCSILFFQFYF